MGEKIGDFVGLPFLSRRSGMKNVRADCKKGNTFLSWEVITSAYGNGFINEKPEILSSLEYEHVVERAKIIEGTNDKTNNK